MDIKLQTDLENKNDAKNLVHHFITSMNETLEVSGVLSEGEKEVADSESNEFDAKKTIYEIFCTLKPIISENSEIKHLNLIDEDRLESLIESYFREDKRLSTGKGIVSKLSGVSQYNL